MIIPFESLSPETLDNIIESFVLMEGTDYGEQEISLLDKVEQVKAQIKNGEALIEYSEEHESVTIIPKNRI
uniref:YheU family protein n=1 Tax=Ningiella ruwaisensis TaxID=2364274 RepID=UPI00109F4CD7|nr:YheU family protein [Ningiella ruwaisensis]